MRKNQLCFTLKVRSGARTPLEVCCEQKSVNDNHILNNGFKHRASSIAYQVEQTIKRRFGAQNKELEGSEKTPPNSASQKLLAGAHAALLVCDDADIYKSGTLYKQICKQLQV